MPSPAAGGRPYDVAACPRSPQLSGVVRLAFARHQSGHCQGAFLREWHMPTNSAQIEKTGDEAGSSAAIL
jgi:hypothetical protein